MFTLNAFGYFVQGLRTIHARRRTEKILRDLPPHILDDIGLNAPLPRRGR